MEINLATKQDLEDLRKDILAALASYFSKKPLTEKKWLRSKEVRDILKISNNTLQALRVSGKLAGTKVNGLWYYKYEDIEVLLNEGTG